MPYPANSSQPFARNRILIGGVILYVCAFAVLLPNKSFDAMGAVVVLIVFGIAFPLIAWITTRRAVSLSISLKPSLRINRSNRIHYSFIGLSDWRLTVD
jgi:hypothetical protein